MIIFQFKYFHLSRNSKIFSIFFKKRSPIRFEAFRLNIKKKKKKKKKKKIRACGKIKFFSTIKHKNSIYPVETYPIFCKLRYKLRAFQIPRKPNFRFEQQQGQTFSTVEKKKKNKNPYKGPKGAIKHRKLTREFPIAGYKSSFGRCCGSL